MKPSIKKASDNVVKLYNVSKGVSTLVRSIMRTDMQSCIVVGVYANGEIDSARSKMHSTEALGLLEVAKAQLLREMRGE